ncbi:MAG TPA: hypothetical protein VJ939_02275 [Bacteroidales bacterium]|nr:hypothetical protein [Bacteroidales bacterium]
MKKRNLFFVLSILVAGIIFTSCSKDNSNPKPDPQQTVENMEELQISDDFDWKTTDLVFIDVKGLRNGTVLVKDQNGKVHHKLFHNMFTHISKMISIPDKLDNVIIEYQGESVIVPVIDGKITHSFIE